MFENKLYFKRILTIKYIKLIILLSVSFVNAASFEFFGTAKRIQYNIEDVSSRISNEYKTEFRVTSVVIASKSCSNRFEKQFEVVRNLDAETFGLIFIFACAKKENEHGYHTSRSVALRVLAGANERLLIYSPDGTEIYNGQYILKLESVLELLEKHNI